MRKILFILIVFNYLSLFKSDCQEPSVYPGSVKKYLHKTGLGEFESMDEIMERAKELMMQGRTQEGAELMRKASENMQKGLEKGTSADAVDIWIECLDELASVAYPIEIRLQIIGN